jgi:Tfp pilus assembly protein PilV
MLPDTSALVRRLLARLRGQAGMTIVETMVAAVILTAGTLGVLVMVETADKVNKANTGREAATGLSRELLETARSTTYATVGDPNWFNASLSGVSGGSGTVATPVAGTSTTTVTRRGYTFTVSVNACSVDDSKDGLKASAGTIRWCSDSTGTGTGDTQPEDLKRVGVTTSWTQGTKSYSLFQTATFTSVGALIGPTITDFKITSPTGLDASAPTITSTPTGNVVVFQATSVGAANMIITVDGVPQSTGVSGGTNGIWTFNWNLNPGGIPLKDGVYTIGATAVDALGTNGDPQYIQVKLARGAASAPANVTGSYNDVYVAGTKTRVVELGWDGAPEGSVTGYEVWKGATAVCSARLVTECTDFTPASSGSTTYTVKTLYTDAAGVAQSVSSTYTVTAPATAVAPTQFWFANSSAISQTNCLTPPTTFARPGSKTDMPSTAPSGTEVAWTYATNGNVLSGCLTPFTAPATIAAQANGFVVSGYFKNTLTGSVACKLQWLIYKGVNATTATPYGGNAIAGSPATFDIPANTTTVTKFTATLGTLAGSFAVGDQISITLGGFGQNSSSNKCGSTTVYYNASAHPLTATITALSGGAPSGSPITRPAAPTGLTGTANADGTTTLTWTPPTGTPAAEFYRIYRDGQNYANRVDTAGDTGAATVSWTDTNVGGTTHVYRVTAASTVLAESDPAGPLTK